MTIQLILCSKLESKRALVFDLEMWLLIYDMEVSLKAKRDGNGSLDGLKLGQILERKLLALLVLANDLELGSLGSELNNHHLELFG